MPNIIIHSSWGGANGDVTFGLGPFLAFNRQYRSVRIKTSISDLYIMKGTVPTDINNYSVPTDDILINFTTPAPNGTLEIFGTHTTILTTDGDYTQAIASGTATHFLCKIPPQHIEGTDPYWIMDTNFSFSGQNITAGAFYRLQNFDIGKIEIIAPNGVISY